MRNPLLKRLPRELKGECGKYIVIFLFTCIMISFVSGFLVANNSMSSSCDESFEKYNIEDGNFELLTEADSSLIEMLEKEDITIFQNYYIEKNTKEVDSKLRIFRIRRDINKICLMDGELPQNAHEIAIDRMYADNNKLSVGDPLTVGGTGLKITGLIALPDYSCLYSSPSDMIFDATKFGAAVVTDDCFDSFGTNQLHYSYSWKYGYPPADDSEAKDMSESFLDVLAAGSTASHNMLTNYIPRYINQAILFAGNDIKNDNTMITVFLYIVILIIAFIFAITSSNTITKEANVIGTLRATGYTKGELVRHYLAMPMLVILVASIIGNILGYTLFKEVAVRMYYGSYSLPTYVTLWNADAFLKTTVIPLIIMFLINLFILVNKLSLSPLKFIRRDISKRKKKKAFRLNTKIGIMKRFRIRIIFQNIPNYITIFIGIFLANVILLFGFMFTPLLDHFQDEITSNMLSGYQYILKVPHETTLDGAEKYCADSLETIECKLKSENVSVYGISENSAYVNAKMNGENIAVSNAYAEKFGLEKGEQVTLKEKYGDKEYTFRIDDIYYYPAGIAVFMDRQAFNSLFGYGSDYFNGYFSNEKITDIDEAYIATIITEDDLTKTSRQLKTSIGSLMKLFLVFGIMMFMMIIYLLSKIVIEKNSQSISMTKILGYSHREISSLYIFSTTIVVILSMLVTLPIISVLMKYICIAVFADFSGWLEYYVPFTVYIKIFVIGAVAYSLIAFALMKKIRRIPLGDALKNAE